MCAFPFPDSVPKFIAAHDKVFVVEQNCDAQMRAMLVNELEINPAQLVKVLHYDGTPITARYITRAIRDTLQPAAADSQKGRPHDLDCQTQAASSDADQEQGRLYAA